MTAFEGIVTLAEDEVPVKVGLEPERVTLVAGDVQIGEWAVDECLIVDQGNGTWVIEAEAERLSFLPDEPGLFAQSLNGDAVEAEPVEETPASASDSELRSQAENEDEGFEIVDGPEPRSATLIGFYALAGLTGVLGLWALVSFFI